MTPTRLAGSCNGKKFGTVLPYFAYGRILFDIPSKTNLGALVAGREQITNMVKYYRSIDNNVGTLATGREPRRSEMK